MSDYANPVMRAFDDTLRKLLDTLKARGIDVDALLAGTHVVVPREPTEAMWIAGRKPILARDVLQGGGSARFTLGDHMREIGDAAYARGDELRLQRLSKGDCAVMVYRAMLAATPSPAKPED